MRVILALACLPIFGMPSLAQQSLDSHPVIVGPWTIETTYKAEKFENCTMTRTADGLGVMFVRNQEGLMLSIDSPKWKLERGKAYSVHLFAGPRSIEAKALAGSKSVMIALADAVFNKGLRTADSLEVEGEGTTFRLPLEGSAAGLDRLDLCLEKNVRQSPDSNPFVAPAKRP